MFGVMSVMICGIVAGFLLRKRKRLFILVGRLNLWIILLLMFAMGLAVGGNSEVMDNLGGLGLDAIGIGLGAMAGSVALSVVVYKYLFKKEPDK